MTRKLSIAGGFYRELCRFPQSDETWGSGGRAAAFSAGLGVETDLTTLVDSASAKILDSISHTFGFKARPIPIERTRAFQYDHGLSSPIIWPPVESSPLVSIELSGDPALVFGMLEAEPKVQATTLVYDPQNPSSPSPIKATPTHLAYVLNATEARLLTGSQEIEAAARNISDTFSADAVVIKMGARGALVLHNQELKVVPSYRTVEVWPIGSGDIFTAAFACKWAVEGTDPFEAAAFASRATALYVNSRVLPIPAADINAEAFPFQPMTPEERSSSNDYDVYLAGPFFNMPQRWLIEESRVALTRMGLKVFSPFHDVGMGVAKDVAPQDIAALKQSCALYAIIDGTDPGTVFEIGYARSIGKPVVLFGQSTAGEPLKMMLGTGCELVSDFVSSIYRVAWAAREK